MPEEPEHADSRERTSSSLPKARLRISKVLEARMAEEGSYSKLEKAIKDAIREPNGELPDQDGAPRSVDRRKLKGIVDNDPRLVLSIGELRAIDQYLEPFGDGLAYNPLFEKPEVLRCLAASRRVDFMLGSKPDDIDHLRINISHWDFLGLNRIQSGVQSFSRNVHVGIREVRMHKKLNAARAALGDSSLSELFGERGPSLVCLGSTRSCAASELMLSRMAGLEPLQHLQPGAEPDLPFQFVWSQSREYVHPSPFHLYGEDANRDDPRVGEAVLQREAACFRYANGYLIDELSQQELGEGYTYALCAAQRRERGQVWLLVAGLTGPATSAAAQWVDRMPAALDDHKPGQRSPVFWYLLRAKATRVGEDQRETVRVGEAEVVAGGQAWG